MKKTNIIIAVLLVLLSAFFIKVGLTKSGDKDKKESKEKADKKVDAYIVKTSLLTSDITVSGSLEAYDEVDLKNETAGRIVYVNLPEGKFVRKGTLLIKLYNDDLLAALRKLEAQLAIQTSIFNRQSKLMKVNGISQNDYEQTILQLNSIKADIAEEKALIRKTEVKAPFDGTIGLRNVSVGAVVSSSTLLATIRTNQNIKLDFWIPEKYSPMITVGMNVGFTVYNNNRTYYAKVIATEHGIDNTTGNLKVRAIIKSQSKELVPGAFANVQLNLGDDPKALMIPTEAIIPEEENKTVIIARQGKAHFVNIKTGIRQASKIQVIDGLEPGDTIMTSGLLFLKEDSKLSYSSVNK
jgi:membrane fusion protein, multidrug efflux system